MQYFTTVQGIVWKFVCCEKCSTTYDYRMEISATGTGSSFLFLNNEGAQTAAGLDARNHFLWKAENKVAPVPCPVCGHYQQSMQRGLRRKLHWIHFIGLPLLVASAAFLADPGLQTIGIALAALAGVLLVTGFVVKFFHNPSAGDPEARKKLGQTHAVWGDELLRLVNE